MPNINIRVSDKQKEEYSDKAAKEGRTISNWIKRILDQALAKD